MKKIEVKQARGVLKGTISVPPDKSISHRAVMISALTEGKTRIKNFLLGEDCLRTLEAFKSLGVKYILNGSILTIEGKGLYGFKEPRKKIFIGNSGTTIRLMLGVLAAQDFKVTLEGDESLNKRPMQRVMEPLRMMGARIEAVEDNFAPLTIHGAPLRAISYKQNVASAQVKSCILLAGLYANGITRVYEKIKTRDHTERMLKSFSAEIKRKGLMVSINPKNKLISPGTIDIPTDFSSAAFFMAAAVIVPGSKIIITNVGLNPTRIGFLNVLRAMGADIKKKNQKQVSEEPRADLIIKFKSSLKAVNIEKENIPSMIDELPIAMIVATQAKGKTVIKGAGELRVKETDRINSMVMNLRKMGADIEVKKDDISIKGPVALNSAVINSFGDHRTAMSFAVAALMARGKTVIQDTECIDTSFPGFSATLKSIL